MGGPRLCWLPGADCASAAGSACPLNCGWREQGDKKKISGEEKNGRCAKNNAHLGGRREVPASENRQCNRFRCRVICHVNKEHGRPDALAGGGAAHSKGA